MAEGIARRSSRGHRTICLPIKEEDYSRVIHDPKAFRHTLDDDDCFRQTPELFPVNFALGYELKDDRMSAKWSVSQITSAWFKNAHFRVTAGFRVTLGTSAQTLIGPALERVFASPWLPCWDFSSARTACTPEAPASEHAAHPSATRQDSCRLDWGLHCAGTGGGSRRTEAASSSPCPTAAAGRSSCAADC